ncbi:CocE/NonD family hydrolase [Nonomuraea bangladeshensis]|uniref:CocE/NonD family hydrolase n=1 Tax=Nonomuraea bangladeshensis TaxID=404385 RepID=A0ABV3H0P6_9ACTN
MYRGGIYSARIRDWQRSTAPDTLTTYARHPLYDDFWRERSVKARWKNLDIPVLEIAGWYDRYRQGMVENFQALRPRPRGPRAPRHGLGEPDCDEGMRLIYEVLPTLAEQAGHPAFRQGGGDSVAYVFAPPGAAAAAAAFEAEVRALASPWWRIVPSLYGR